MANVAFYTDKPGNTDEDLEAVRKYFEAGSPVFLNAKPVSGFESGLDWMDMADRGFIAVVLYDVNDACAFGISLEARNAGLKVYEMFGDELLELSCLQVTGKMPVSNFKKAQLT
jgi:hypothetical protein